MRSIVPSKLEDARIREGRWGSDAGYGLCGAFDLMGPCGVRLRIMAGAADLPESEGWEHVSVSTLRRNPNWQEMCWVKDLFWRDDELVAQFHPPKSDHINIHPYCLHLWRHPDMRLPPRLLV